MILKGRMCALYAILLLFFCLMLRKVVMFTFYDTSRALQIPASDFRKSIGIDVAIDKTSANVCQYFNRSSRNRSDKKHVHRIRKIKTGGNCLVHQTGDPLERDKHITPPIAPGLTIGESSSKRRLPKLIVIGSRKCGTAAFRRFFKLHPDVHSSFQTEPHFFDVDENFCNGVDFYKSIPDIRRIFDMIRGIMLNKCKIDLLYSMLSDGAAEKHSDVKKISVKYYNSFHPFPIKTFSLQTHCGKAEIEYFQSTPSKISKVPTNRLRLMMPCTKESEITFEKTPNYLVTPSVPERIISTYEETGVEPKFILVLCDPAQRVFSDFKFSKRDGNASYYNQNEKFSTFDHYIEFATKEIKRVAGPFKNSTDIYQRLEKVQAKKDLNIVTASLYSIYLRHWLQFFNLNRFVFVNGDRLMTDPGAEMIRVQQLLNLPLKVTRANFEFVKERGFYCVRGIDRKKKIRCLSRTKGNTRAVANDGIVISEMSTKSKSTLDSFFCYFVKDLYDLTGFGHMWYKCSL